MKTFFTLLFALFCSNSTGNPVYNQLLQLNPYWTEHKAVALPTGINAKTEKDRIRLHLSLVEQTLRSVNTANLTAAQKQNRLQCLDYLHGYMLAGNFPQNEDYNYRTPIFIDKHDNFCAVGFLIKATGHEEVSRMIAAKTNLAKVKEMDYPEIPEWAEENGFTIDELAWIQPTYGLGTERKASPVGKGVNGTVNELYSDNINGKLYVGGNFTIADSSVNANNIAYVTESNGVHTWHNIRNGVNGPVYAIAEYNNNIYVAGSFTMADTVPVTNVAYWDGTNWHNAGCTYGVVKDLVVFNGSLYASGHFDVCAAMMEVNFAKWDGAYWQQQFGLTGSVNTMEVMDTVLLLGGWFTYNSTQVNVLKWNENIGFVPFANTIKNEVNDFEMFKGKMYSVSKQTIPNSQGLIGHLSGNTWDTLSLGWPIFNDSVSFNTLCSYADTFMMGGRFDMGFINGALVNCANIAPLVHTPMYNDEVWFWVDSTINKMTIFNGKLYAGGAFKYGNNNPHLHLNGITYMTKPTLSVDNIPVTKNTIILYPNPAASNATITIKTAFKSANFRLTDITAKLLIEQKLNGNHSTVQLPSLAAGMYMAEVSDSEGSKTVEKLEVR